MKCPMCLGKGYATDEDIKEYPHRCPNCNGKGFYAVDWQKVRCEVCNGSGKKPMTEQEYLQTCGTEQLAESLFNIMANNEFTLYLLHTEKKSMQEMKDAVVEWLKQPHTPKE